MLSISGARSAGGAATYFSSHLQEKGPAEAGRLDDYYAGEGDRGRWVGGGLEKLGIESREVTSRDFLRVCAAVGRDGERLAQNAGDPDRRAGWDATFSAPKSVSVCWALADPTHRAQIEAAQAVAVERALAVMQEKACFARTGRDGENLQRGALVAATFQHGTSREQDPQLHTHAFIMNLAVREDGKVSSLDAREMMRWQKAVGAVYRAELALQLRGLGYKTERDGAAFRVAGVPKGVEQEFSQRRAQIIERLNELGLKDAKSAENVTLETRSSKVEIDRETLQTQWAARAEAAGLDRAALAALRDPNREYTVEMPTAAGLLKTLTEHDAVIDERRILQAAAEAAQEMGGADGARLRAETVKLAAVEIQGFDGKTKYTTRELLQAERDVLRLAQARAQETKHQLKPAEVERAIAKIESQNTKPGAPFKLRDEQREAVRLLAAAPGATAVMVGDAGTGKSTSLAAVRQAYESAGFKVVGAALAGKAAAGLQADAGIKSSTIDRLQFDLERGAVKLDSKTIVIVDEAGMVDSRKMAVLSRAAHEAGAKMILVGDHKQLQPVGAGATFRHLSAAVPAARLQEIGRQREGWAREAVREMSRGEAARALARYAERGAVRVTATHAAAVRAVADRVIADRAAIGARGVVAIAGTNTAVRDLNSAIRDRLRGAGELKGEREIKVRDGNDPEKTVNLKLAVGERIVVTRNENKIGLKNGDFATVVSVSSSKITLALDRTEKHISVDPAAVAMRHGYAATTHRLQGATVERAVVLGSEHTSREMAYVQASRSKGETTFVFAAAKVAKLELAAGVESDPRAAPLARLGAAIEAMSRENQKESTLDYRERDPSFAPPSLDQLRDVAAGMGRDSRDDMGM